MRILRFAPFVLCLSLAGCGMFASHDNGPLIADVWSPIKDVPVPVGFSQAEDARADVGNGPRIVDQKYTGSDGVLPVAAFYKEQLPRYGWKQDAIEQVSGKEVILHFSKEKGQAESCTVKVTARTFDTAIRIRIVPTLTPATGRS